MKQHDISVIGLGNLGSTMLDAFDQHDLPVKSIFNRSEEKAKKISSKYHIDTAKAFPNDKSELGNLIFLTVADDTIGDTASRLAALSDNWKGISIVHCSGNASVDLLASLKEKGGEVASFHPLQTFSGSASAATFRDIFFSLQGDTEVFPSLHKIAQNLGAETLEVDAQQKAHLHVAAVMASNYLITLMDAAVQTANKGALNEDQLRKALLPLIKTTLSNVEQTNFAEALTGPIRRGDLQTVKDHLALLDQKASLKKLYRTLGLQTLELARASGSLEEEKKQALEKIFEQS